MNQDITARLAAAAQAPTAVLIAQGPSLLAEAELAIHATRAAAALAVTNLTGQVTALQQEMLAIRAPSVGEIGR